MERLLYFLQKWKQRSNARIVLPYKSMEKWVKFELFGLDCGQTTLYRTRLDYHGDHRWNNRPRYIGTWLLPPTIHLRHLGWGKFKAYTWVWLLPALVERLYLCRRPVWYWLGWSPWALATSVSATWVGVGDCG